ncbi:MAG: TraB/GumN family protein [Spirochaetota bacterium]
MIDAAERRYILERAYVSEHSPELMTLVSGGEAHLVDDCVIYTGRDWLIVVGYPLSGGPDQARLGALVGRLRADRAPRSCWVIAPSIPEALSSAAAERESDMYYRLDLGSFAPARRLLRETGRAAERLSVERSDSMGGEHRRLTDEFLRHARVGARVEGLYRAMPSYTRSSRSALVLSARTLRGELAAFYVLDMAPGAFASYVVGCHSGSVDAPHASDLLFLEMVAAAREHGKRSIDLGLGVNEGIRRFKLKWGAMDFLPYRMCGLVAPPEAKAAAPSLDSGRDESPSRFERVMFWRKHESEYRMLWEIRRGRALNLLGGTAHFFCRSFRRSFERIIGGVDCVLFEGPLGEESMRLVRERGMEAAGRSPLYEALDRQTRSRIAREFAPPALRPALHSGFAPSLQHSIEDEICRDLLEGKKPWLAFFGMWTEFLRKRGWVHSVDLEAHGVAARLGKKIVYLESIEEQVEAMEGIPFDSIVAFLGMVDRWEALSREHARRFIAGDTERIFKAVSYFPSRCESIIDCRDPVFFERMTPYIEKGNAAVLVGASHLPGLRGRLEDAGWTIGPYER